LNQNNWKIEFKWVKAHAGIFGNEIAARRAKEATQNNYVTYRRIPKSAVKKDTRKESIKNGNVNGRKQRKGRLLKKYFQV